MSEVLAGVDFWMDSMVQELYRMDALVAFPLAVSLSATTGAWNACLHDHLPRLEQKMRHTAGCCICKSNMAGQALNENTNFHPCSRR